MSVGRRFLSLYTQLSSHFNGKAWLSFKMVHGTLKETIVKKKGGPNYMNQAGLVDWAVFFSFVSL